MRNPGNVLVSRHVAGTILAERQKGNVLWQARISEDRGRLQVCGIVPASTTATVIEPLDERELRQLLGEGVDLDDRHEAVEGRIA